MEVTRATARRVKRTIKKSARVCEGDEKREELKEGTRALLCRKKEEEVGVGKGRAWLVLNTEMVPVAFFCVPGQVVEWKEQCGSSLSSEKAKLTVNDLKGMPSMDNGRSTRTTRTMMIKFQIR